MEAIREFTEDIWLVDGPAVADTGVLFTTRMTIVRLSKFDWTLLDD